VAYSEIEDVEIGGPGMVRSGGGFVGGGFGAVGALEGMAVASVLNALTNKTKITTIIRAQATTSELFLLWDRTNARAAPHRVVSASRRDPHHPDAADQKIGPSASPVAELSKLADMLQSGLLTRDEFDQLKTRLLHG
jgi:hypothetical protein